MLSDASSLRDLEVFGRVFFASFLGLFNGAELEDAARIVFWCDGPPPSAVPQEALERRLF